MHKPPINIDKFGWNATKTDVSFHNDQLTFCQRGLLFAAIFLVIALVPGIALYKEGFDYSVMSILLAVLALLFSIVALLYAIYVQRVELDFNTRTFIIENGFLGFVKVYRGPFKNIEGVHVRKTVTQTKHSDISKISSVIRWEINLRCRPRNPTFGLYETDNAESARYISNVLSQNIGCAVLTENNPFE